MRFPTAAGLLLLALSLLCFAGEGSRKAGKGLDATQATRLAVQIANKKCKAQYGAEPFDSSFSTAKLVESRWQWGGLDVVGRGGYSARVSFDKHGTHDSVEVYLTTDRRSESLKIENLDNSVKGLEKGQ